jgi:RNA polymerase sigma factor (sigma-70 family)
MAGEVRGLRGEIHVVSETDVLACLPIVRKIAHQICRLKGLPFSAHEDLVQEGMLGVQRATVTFDAERAGFKTYALARAHGYMLHHVRDYHHRGARSEKHMADRPAPASLENLVDAVDSDDRDLTFATVTSYIEPGYDAVEWDCVLLTYPLLVTVIARAILAGDSHQEIRARTGLTRRQTLPKMLAALGEAVR